jgi:site-specific recombinase XerD
MPISVPEVDEWKLADTDENSQHCGRAFIFDFIHTADTELKTVFKAYIWRNYRVRNRTVKKLYEDHICFRHFNACAMEKGITAFRNITYSTVVEFISYLRLKISDNTNNPLSHKYQKSCLDALKSVIHWCQIRLPDRVLEREVFAGNEYRGINKRLRIDFIPDDVLVQVNNTLENEENCFVRYGIVILESTGIRLGDMLALETNCIRPHPISGHTMEWYDHKGRRARPPMPVTQDCVNAVMSLETYTRELRKEADSRIKEYLFIHRPGRSGITEVTTITQMSFGNWLKAFVRKNDIRGTDGDFYRLTAHKFRRTLATDMLSKGADIKVVQEVLGHASVLTAKKYYADVKDKEMA